MAAGILHVTSFYMSELIASSDNLLMRGLYFIVVFVRFFF